MSETIDLREMLDGVTKQRTTEQTGAGTFSDDRPILAFPYPKMPRKAFIEGANKAIEEARRKGQLLPFLRKFGESSLFFFCVYLLGFTFLDTDFDYALCKAVEDKKYGRLWLIAREHHKSTIITIASTIREILMDPEATTIIYSYKQTIAQTTFYQPIKTQLENNTVLKALYPDVLWDDPKSQADIWQAERLCVKRKSKTKECTLECDSVFSQKTGTHFSKLIFDDVVTLESVRTAESIQATKDAWLMSLNTGQTENLNICVIGTFYHYAELYSMIIDKGLLEEVFQPCVDVNGHGVLYSDNALANKKLKMGSAVWATQMMLDPKQGKSMGFQEEWLRRWKCQTYAGLNVYVLVDPAGKAARKRDYTVMWVIGLDAADNYYVIDLIRDKLTLTQRADAVFFLQRTYKPAVVFYEEVGMQADREHILDRMERENYRFNIRPISQTMDKGLRIDGLQPVFEAGRIWLPPSCKHLNWEGQNEDMLDSFIKNEYLMYPFLEHDDALDDLANIIHPDVVPMLARPDAASEEQQVYEALYKRGILDKPFPLKPLQMDSYDPLSYN